MNNYIPKEVFGAVMFAKKLLSKGKRREVAIEVAAKACKKDEEEIEEYINVPLEPKKYCWHIIVAEDELGTWLHEACINSCYSYVKYAEQIKEKCDELKVKNPYTKYIFEVSPDIYKTIAVAGDTLVDRLETLDFTFPEE
jgi:hypothetical protein